jgi:hypothetical protein
MISSRRRPLQIKDTVDDFLCSVRLVRHGFGVIQVIERAPIIIFETFPAQCPRPLPVRLGSRSSRQSQTKLSRDSNP